MDNLLTTVNIGKELKLGPQIHAELIYIEEKNSFTWYDENDTEIFVEIGKNVKDL